MLPAKQKRTHAAFYRAARNSSELDPKTALTAYLAAAMAMGCYP